MPTLAELSRLLLDLGLSEADAEHFASGLVAALRDQAREAQAQKTIRKLLDAKKGKPLGLQGAGLLAYLSFVYTALSENESDRIQREHSKEMGR